MLSLHQQFLSADGLSAASTRALLDTAMALRRAAESGIEQPLLRGKNIALLCTDPQCKAASDFADAASRLGARVSRLRPDKTLFHGDGGSLRMLARLYDAIECHQLPREDAQRLQRMIGVPVFNGISQAGHPLAALVHSLPQPSSADDPMYLVQAALVQSMG